jgi:ubiquinone/menaquinone biosynthesis C-methylase UbiE
VEKLTLEQIREFWTQQAIQHGQSPSASWSDHMVIEMEIREILNHLTDGDKVLDIGCANGYSTIQLAAQRKIQIRGLDYVPEMIEQGNQRLSELKGRLSGTVEFGVDDIRALGEPSESYDKVVVIRVIINLGDWTNQLQALRECVRVLKSGGTFILSEATLQGWRQLNKFRREWGLSDIPMPPFNSYLDQDRVIGALAPDLEVVSINDFASTYYVGTRVLKPLLIQALGADINAANPSMEWNRWFSQLPAWGDYGTQKLLLFRKR